MSVTCKECSTHYPNAKQLSPAHVKKSHGMSIPQYEQKHGQYSSLDKSEIPIIMEEHKITCKICHFEFTNVITTAHLKLHGITSSEYKENYGETYSQYEKSRRSNSAKGNKNPLIASGGHSEETKRKISETTKAQYDSGREGYFTGKTLTPEHRQKLKDAKQKDNNDV